jgi:hypothetical protein
LDNAFKVEVGGVSAIVNDNDSETEDVFECKVVSLACEEGTPVDAGRCKSVGEGIPDEVSRLIFFDSILVLMPESPPFIAARKASRTPDRVRRGPAIIRLVG